MLDSPWQYAAEHRQGFTDIFRMNGEERKPVQLELGLRACNLLLEEYPLAERDLTPQGRDRWLLKTEVANYLGVGRFVIGLLDDIRIINTPELEEYLRQYARQYLF